MAKAKATTPHPKPKTTKKPVNPGPSNGGKRAEIISTLDVGGNIDQIRIIAYPFQGRQTILEDVLVDFTWTEDARQLASVEASITFKNIGDFAKDTLAPGTWLYPQYFDPQSDSWKYLDPPLYVWDVTRTDINTQMATITAFDITSFLNRQDAANWIFKDDKKHKGGWYAHEIAQQILFELEIAASVVKGKYKIPYLYLQGHNPIEVILKAYTRDRQITNILYRLQAVGKKVVIQPFTKQARTWVIESGSNLISSSWNESLDEVATEVVVISTSPAASSSNATGGVIINGGARAISANVRKYGRIRNVVYLDRKVGAAALKVFAREALKYVSKTKDTIEIEAEGLIPLRAGDAVYVNDPFVGLQGRYFCKAVSHTVQSGQHTMNITLDRAAIVPVLYPTRDELVKNSTTGLIGVKAVQGPLGVAWYPPLGTKKYQTSATAGNGPHAQGTTWMEISAVDLKAPSGTAVHAAQTGIIRGLGDGGTAGHLTGKRLYIEGSQGGKKPTVFYSGLGTVEADIVNGAKVNVGEQIGTIGAAGFIHFAVSKGSYADTARNLGVDPTPFINPSPTNTNSGSSPTSSGATTTYTAGQGSTTPVTSGDNQELRVFARKVAIAYKIDPNLFEKQIQQESGFQTNRTSSAGAGGIAQIVPQYHPAIAPYIGRDPKKELNYAARLMAKQLVSYNRRWDLALAAYNGGSNRLADVGMKVERMPLETINYVKIITGTLAPTTQSQGPAPNAGGDLTFPPGVS